MPTTRHHLNGARRRQAREALRAQGTPDAPEGRGEPRDQPSPSRTRRTTSDETANRRTGVAVLTTDTRTERQTERRSARRSEPRPERAKSPAPPDETTPRRARSTPRRTLAALCLLTLLLGGFAGWAHARAESLRDAPAARNTALSDTARTSEIKGQTATAVAALFSYDHADPDAFDAAAKKWLTGRAVAQHRDMFGDIRERADQQKAVITTTVTDSAVERIDGDRARVLVYADQSSVSTAGDKSAKGKQTKDEEAAADDGTYAGAMLAVDLLRRDGRWLVAGIDTFGR
ncbi:hypothetical protein ACFV6E_37935 [Streptomyces sp. NPDC059785]|uniref:hypothetical protein n=1 Tax=unclassified Streptomyces TaxID=2593676 RepID=UPI0036647074